MLSIWPSFSAAPRMRQRESATLFALLLLRRAEPDAAEEEEGLSIRLADSAAVPTASRAANPDSVQNRERGEAGRGVSSS